MNIVGYDDWCRLRRAAPFCRGTSQSASLTAPLVKGSQ